MTNETTKGPAKEQDDDPTADVPSNDSKGVQRPCLCTMVCRGHVCVQWCAMNLATSKGRPRKKIPTQQLRAVIPNQVSSLLFLPGTTGKCPETFFVFKICRQRGTTVSEDQDSD